jgi:hypothetical protein
VQLNTIKIGLLSCCSLLNTDTINQDIFGCIIIRVSVSFFFTYACIGVHFFLWPGVRGVGFQSIGVLFDLGSDFLTLVDNMIAF